MNMNLKTIHPFPGLRPFEEDEEYLFFGREKSVTELMARLRVSRFVAVIGTSGSGKSSLVKSGLLPSLYRGFMANAGSCWRIGVFRPGDNPIGNMSKVLAEIGLLSQGLEKNNTGLDMNLLHQKFIESTLRRSNLGLTDVIQQSRLQPHENILVIVDQFEELFRFSKIERTGKYDGKMDSAAFIKLLIENTKNSDIPIYIMITMRSDFMGECTEYEGLPEAINNGLYLIPRMTRDEKRMAITGPITVAGGKITPSLLSRILNDAGDNPDQLPIMQHSLMRTWDYWVENRVGDEPMSLKHYYAIGTMEHALSQHAEEAFAELKSERSRYLCEKMYKLITEIGENGRGIRRPAKIREICLVANASLDEVIQVVEIFRKQGRAFLMPPYNVPLDEETVIDISHESYMRIWARLIDWVIEEAKSADLYNRLAKAAALHEEEKAALWRDPELMLGLNWQKENNPNPIWADRYDPSFDRAIRFLDASKEQKEFEIKEKEREQKLKIKRNRIFTSIISIIALIAIILALWAVNNQRKAAINEKKAIEQKIKAEKSEKIANEQKQKAEKNEIEARKQKIEADKQRSVANSQKNLALQNEEKSRIEEKRAREAESLAKQAESKANENAFMEKIQGLKVDMNKEEANFRQFLAKSRELALQSRTIPPTGDTQLRILLALISYRINQKAYTNLNQKTRTLIQRIDKTQHTQFSDKQEFHRKYSDLMKTYEELQDQSQKKHLPSEIFEALRDAYIYSEKEKDIILNNVESWALALDKANNIIFNNREGELLKAPLQADNSKLPYINNQKFKLISGSPQSILQVSSFSGQPDDDYILCGTTDGRLIYWTKKNWEQETLPEQYNSKILSVALCKSQNALFFSVKNTLYLSPLPRLSKSKKPQPIFSTSEANNYILSILVIEKTGTNGSFLIAGDEKGNLYRLSITRDMNKSKMKELKTTLKLKGGFHAIAYSPQHELLALGDSNGKVHLLPQINTDTLTSDNPIQHHTLETTSRGIVNALAFSPQGKYLTSGGMNGTINLWNLKQDNISNIPKLTPSLTITGKQKILSLIFDTKEEYIIFNDERNLRICPTEPDQFIVLLCRKKIKDLTPQEWRNYVGESINPQDITICSALKEN